MAKKLKKLLAVTLALSMTMSLLNLSAFAANDSAAPLTVEVGETITLTESSGTTSETVVDASGTPGWATSDPSVATVVDGDVTGAGEGTATITHTIYRYRFTYQDENQEEQNVYYAFDQVSPPEAVRVETVTTWNVTVIPNQKVAAAEAALAEVIEPAEDNIPAVIAAYQACEKLTEEQKAQLTNTDKLELVETYMDGKAYVTTSKDGIYTGTFDTTFTVCAPSSVNLQQTHSSFAFFSKSNTTTVSNKLSSDQIVKFGFDKITRSKDCFKPMATALADDEEIVLMIHSKATESLPDTFKAYFTKTSNAKVIEEIPAELQGDTVVIRLTNKNAHLVVGNALAFTVPMFTSDIKYSTPTTAENSVAPITHPKKTTGITPIPSIEDRNEPDDPENVNRIITITIPDKDFGDTIHLEASIIETVFRDLGIGFEDVFETPSIIDDIQDSIAPGSQFECRINIVNNSKYDYRYEDGSLWFATGQNDIYTWKNKEYTSVSEGGYPTFDGAQFFPTYRCMNPALDALMRDIKNANTDPNITEFYPDDATLEAFLKEHRYPKDASLNESLPHYYLDWCNSNYGTQATNLDQLPDEILRVLFSGQAQYTDKDGNSISESVPEINSLAHNFLYNHVLHIGETNVGSTDYADSYGSYMSDCSELDRLAGETWKTLPSGTQAELTLNFTVGGAAAKPYAWYPVTCDMGLTLNKVHYYKVVHKYYTNDNAEPDGTFEDPTLYKADLGAVISADSIEKLPTFDGKDYTFNADQSDKSITMVADPNANVITLRYYRAESTSYKVVHQYYTNDNETPDGSTSETKPGKFGDVITAESIEKRPTFDGKDYTYSSIKSDSSITLGANADSNIIYLRYYRVDTSTSYEVIHEYYTDDTLDGSANELKAGEIGAVIEAANLEKFPSYKGKDYTYVPDEDHSSITLVADPESNVIYLRYYRTTPTTPPTPSTPDYYKVTVNYYDKDTGEKIATSYISSPIREGKSYDVTDKDAIAIEGYTYDSTSGDPLTGVMDSDKVINVYYVAEVEELPDPEPPLEEKPEEPEEPEEIPEPDVPLVDVPETGDLSLLWLLAAAVSGLGLAVLTIAENKRKRA